MPEKNFDSGTFSKKLPVYLRLGANFYCTFVPECLKPKLFLHFNPTLICLWGPHSQHFSHQLFLTFFFLNFPPDGGCFSALAITGLEQQPVRSETESGPNSLAELRAEEPAPVHEAAFQPADLSPWSEAGLNFKQPPVL